MKDENIKDVIRKRMEKTRENLIKNRMDCYIVDTAEDVLPLVTSLIAEGCTAAAGGSVTLTQTGVIDLLRNGNYKFLDRAGLTGDAVKKCYRDSMSADVFFCSANAVTEKGELYNVDGNGNRVAALCYGPDSVIVIAGYNKIVCNIEEAVRRVKTVAAPANSLRLGCDTYCREKGECMAYASGEHTITAGCRSEQRICCTYVITACQREKGRIKVILVGERLGY